MITLNKISTLLLYLFLCIGIATAEEQEEHYIESAKFILNIQNLTDSESIIGYLLATPCDTCQPTRIEVDQHTIIHLNGHPIPLRELGTKIDWQGAVFYVPSKPPTATRLMLN